MKFLLWASVGLVFYVYVLYPALLVLLSKMAARKREQGAGSTPTVSMLVAAFNEEEVILDKVRNFQALDYPEDRIELLIGTDGCTDRTDELLKSQIDDRIRLFSFATRRGKAAVLNDLADKAKGEILVFSDANTMYAADAVRRLVRHFASKDVGGVCGRLGLKAPDKGAGNWGEAAYWNFENLLKKLEGKIRTVLGANGAIYALRRELYKALPTDRVINDDFVIPLRAVLRGYDIVYDATAVAYETVAPDVRGEFWRKVRIGAANFNALKEIAPLLSPKRGFVAFALWSHKILRWFIPFALLTALVSNVFLLREPFFRGLFILQLSFYALAGLGYLAERIFKRVPRFFLLPLAFVSANLGLFVGFLRYLTGTQKPTWARIQRSAVE